ncbi:PREDICTED: sodium/potassium/calcium exchanger 5-like [Rhagoletis zephyria]|uniref:sodium/potassium/calcium exchanger 5-like n=1 Tax=Rhagoletis zephyria TaxID=28612 RepID=UPI0008112903|nr:PREDICTED: sodium/potassium/calcium exchanger 5-like [Rhagoletis zephyria]
MRNIVLNQSADYYDEQAIEHLKTEPSTLSVSLENSSEVNASAVANLEKLIAFIEKDIADKKKRNVEMVEAAAQTLLGSYSAPAVGITFSDHLADNLTINKPYRAVSAINEFPPDFMSDRPSIIVFFLQKMSSIKVKAMNRMIGCCTSAPELFTSIIGVFVSDNDIGVGTIVGSAVFNLIAIPGACSFAAYYNLKVMPKITSFPIVRDTLFYVLSIITLILCIKDNQVDWIESIILLCLYAVYIIIMYFNAQIANLVQKDSKKYTHHSLSGSASSINELKGGQKQCKAKKCCCRTLSIDFSNSETEMPFESQPLLLKQTDHSRISPPPAYQATGQTQHSHQHQHNHHQHHQHLHRAHSKPNHRSRSQPAVLAVPAVPVTVDQQLSIIPSAPNAELVVPLDYSKIQLTPSSNGKFKEIHSVSPSSSSNGTPSPEPDLDYEAIHQALSTTKRGKRAYDVEGNHHLLTADRRPTGRPGTHSPHRHGDASDEPLLLEFQPNGEGADWTDNAIIRILLFPFTVLFCMTLPKPSRFCFVFTFLSSIMWIALLTYLIVWMVTLVGFSLGIPDTVSGITILAAGTSIPELISSYLIVKKAGLADMAICNSIGSNIFDILFCLGLPWLLKTFVMIVRNGVGFATLAAASIPIQSTALPLTSVTLLLTIGAMLIIFKVSNWRLSLQTGVLCTVVYIIFLVSSTMLELNV